MEELEFVQPFLAFLLAATTATGDTVSLKQCMQSTESLMATLYISLGFWFFDGICWALLLWLKGSMDRHEGDDYGFTR